MKGWIIGAGAAAVVVGAGATTWAAFSFFNSGPQAAEAFPADTLAMVSIDLDPSASQKVAAFKLANRVPSLKEELGLDSGDDLRRTIFDALIDSSGCDLAYDDDVKPWIGSSAGIGVVDPSDPQPVLALAVTDETKARGAAKLLEKCLADTWGQVGQKASSLGVAVGDDWLVVASDDREAARVLAGAQDEPLAKSDDYTHWTKAAGDPGILTAYAAPGSAAALFEAVGGLADLGAGLGDGLGDDAGMGSNLGPGLGLGLGLGASAWCPGLTESDGTESSSALGDFGGAGATLRFNDAGLELEFASDAGKRAGTSQASDITSLPDDVGAALAIGFADGWVDGVLNGIEETCGAGFDPSAIFAIVNAFTGLDMPDDLKTLTQRSAQLALGPDLDVEAMLNSSSSESLPLALRIMGDPSELEPVIDKLGALAPGAPFFETEAGDDSVTVGFQEAWRSEVAQGGQLGRNDTFRDVVRHADDARAALYVDIAAIKGALGTLLGGSSLEHDLDELAALGASAWTEDDIAHGQLVLRAK